MAEARYETKTLDTFPRGKEIILDYYRYATRARSEGKVVVNGDANVPAALAMGLGDVYVFPTETYSATAASVPQFAQEAHEAAERYGFARDMCGYFKVITGGVLLNRFLWGGEFPRPDFTLGYNTCESMSGKQAQVMSDLYGGLPQVTVDVPIVPRHDAERMELSEQYVALQMHDAIEQMQKITGKGWDDEKFLEAVRYSMLTHALYAEVMLLNRARPAPLHYRTLSSLMPLFLIASHLKEAADCARELRDEVVERIAGQIAGCGTERYRLFLDIVPSWSDLSFFKYLEGTYGAPVVGSWVYTMVTGMQLRKDRRIELPCIAEEDRSSEQREAELRAIGIYPSPTMPLRTRDDGVKMLARWMSRYGMMCMYYPDGKEDEQIALASHLQADGVIIHTNRGCLNLSALAPLMAKAFKNAGIPTVMVEGSSTDARDVDRILRRNTMDTFMERVASSSASRKH